MCVFVLILGGRRAFFLEVGISRHAANLFTFQTHIFFYSFFLLYVPDTRIDAMLLMRQSNFC